MGLRKKNWGRCGLRIPQFKLARKIFLLTLENVTLHDVQMLL